MATVKKLKKAQDGVKKKPITENRFRFEKNMGTDSNVMSAFDAMRKSAGLDKPYSIDTSARAKAIASGKYKEDKKSGDLFSTKKAKSGAALKKQAAVAIAMKKAGKTPKKKMQYGGKAASMAPKAKSGMKMMSGGSMMKSGGKMKTCKYGC